MERLFLNLKMQQVWRKDDANHDEATNDIANYIVGFYNSIRLHSKLGNMLPNAFELESMSEKSIDMSEITWLQHPNSTTLLTYRSLAMITLLANPSPEAAERPEKRERRKKARPGELLAAALGLFVEKGFAATRAEEVAQRAGVSKGTLFLYFPSKEELFKAVVREHIGGTIRDAFSELQNFPGTSAELVHHMMEQWWERYGNTKASGISKLMMSESNNFPELAVFYQQEVIIPGHQLIQKVIQRGIASGEFRNVDVEYAVFSILAPIMFLIMWKHSMSGCCLSGEKINPQRYVKVQADIVVHGLRHTTSNAQTSTSTTNTL
jgi:AcrR family transcriptional regulator